MAGTGLYVPLSGRGYELRTPMPDRREPFQAVQAAAAEHGEAAA